MLLIKIGGGSQVNWDAICKDIVRFWEKEKTIVVHGANKKRDEIAEKLSAPTRTLISPSGISSVYTDERAIDIFLMVYAGLVNKKIVAMINRYGVPAIGLSGVDGRLWRAKHKKEILIKERGKVKLLRGNLTGRVEAINTGLLNTLLDQDYLPVICPPAISFENEIVNTDNDWAIAVMAESMKIKKIVSLFEAPGLLRDCDDEKSLIRHIEKDKIDNYASFARGRMKKKVLGAKRAIQGGVEFIYWGDGRIENPIQSAIQGTGTVIS